MKIGIELNGVLRNTLEKIQQQYEKWYINNPFNEENEVEYKVISDVTSLNLREHLYFKDDEELYSFLYQEHTMEIFGHAGSTEYNSMQDLNDFYMNNRDKHDIYIVSHEIGKSKPASLFFISKFGSLIENIMFYSDATINNMWNTIDVLITANPLHLNNPPDDKILIKYETIYNLEINTKFTIKKIKELTEKIKEIYD
jgi:hypothetical protein